MESFTVFFFEADYYQQFATAQDPQALYRKFARELHPDLGGDKTRFQAMGQAWDAFQKRQPPEWEEPVYPARATDGVVPMTYRRGLYDVEILPGPLVIVTERDDNAGASVTNAWPELAAEICRQFRLAPSSRIQWIEHYPANQYRGETYDQVTMPWDGQRFGGPGWKSLDPDDLPFVSKKLG